MGYHTQKKICSGFLLSLGLNYKVINNNIISIWGISMFQGM